MLIFDKKKYDVVRTDRMAGTDVRSLNEVKYVAGEEGGLENGRIVTLDRKTGTISYATTQGKDLYLHASVEIVPDSSQLTDFIVPKGGKARIFLLQDNDEFSTSAFKEGEEYVAGDAVKLSATGGTFEKDTAGTAGADGVKFEYVETSMLGYIPVITLKVIK